MVKDIPGSVFGTNPPAPPSFACNLLTPNDIPDSFTKLNHHLIENKLDSSELEMQDSEMLFA
jgi:hypothetical protein